MPDVHMVAIAVKNEAPYILELVAYYRTIGFDRIVIGANDCTDGTDIILKALHQAKKIIYIDNTVLNGEVPQHAFYEKVQLLPCYDKVEWLAVLDADEFLNIHVGTGSIRDLTDAAGCADLIRVNWAVYGSSGYKKYEDELCLQRFTLRMPQSHRINGGCKCIIRQPKRFKKIFNHNPGGYNGDKALQVLDGSGLTTTLPLGGNLREHLSYTHGGAPGYEIAQLNHYATKSVEEYKLRQSRGRGAAAKGAAQKIRHDEKYFLMRAGADVPDVSIWRHLPAVRAEIASLLEDQNIRHAQSKIKAEYANRLAFMGEQR